MKQKIWFMSFMTLCLLSSISTSSPAAGKPDVTRHDANFLENAVNMHIEWQSANPVTSVKISMPGVEKEVNVDPYDNKRNRDGYSGEVDVTLNLGSLSGQTFTYIIQLQDELRIKSSPVTGKVKTSTYQQPTTFPQTQQPGMQIQIQQNMPPPQDQSGAQTSGQQLGTLIVSIDPVTVAESGAMWRVDKGQWKRDGEYISNLPEGNHTIEFQDVGNWIKPENKNVVVERGKTHTIFGIYKNR